MRLKALLFAGALISLAPTLPVSSVHAQRVAGAGDDAIPVPKGGMRFRIGATWNRYDKSFQQTDRSQGLTRLPLLDALNVANLGVRELPQLSPAQDALRTLTGSSSLQLTLGPLESRAEVQENITPLSVEYGVTSRFSMGILVPYIEARTTTRFALNPAGVGANVGENPAWSPAGAQSRATNGALLREISAAQRGLSEELARCSSGTATGCELIVGQTGAIQGLLDRALRTERALAAVYGDSVRGGSIVAPIRGSEMQAAVLTAIASLRDDFAAFGVDAIGEQSAPVAASTVFGSAGFARIAGDTALGLGYTTLGNTRRSGMGDIDIAGTFLLFDTFKADQHARLAPEKRGARSALTLGLRFGSGNLPRTGMAYDRGTGLGTNALLFRSTTDIVFGPRVWMSVTVRGAKAMQDKAVVTLPPTSDGATLLEPFAIAAVERQPGLRSAIEIAPRYTISDFFGLTALYQLTRSGDDVYRVTDATAGIDERFTVPAQSLHSAGFAISYSSLISHARSKSRLPVELIYSHVQPLSGSVSGSGAGVPAVATDRLELRFYTGFPRR